MTNTIFLRLISWSSSAKHKLPRVTFRSYCSDKSQLFSILSFYKFKKTREPLALVDSLRPCLTDIEVKGRIYVNTVGINSQICMSSENVERTKELFNDYYGDDIDYKVHPSEFQVFNKLRIMNKKLVDGMDDNFDPGKVGQHLTPEAWNQVLDNHQGEEEPLVLDIRNRYEWQVGRFKTSQEQELRTFNQFDEYADKLENTVEKDKKILMYCTGGIRCELFSAKLKERGFSDVNQLEGGIIKYGQQPDTHNWVGNLFVFDDRLVVPVDGVADSSKKDVITACWHCGAKVETHYNCANTLCNNVFAACDDCALQHVSSCSVKCSENNNNYIKRNSKQITLLKRSIGKGDHFRTMIKKLF